jgi:hypothetical protein
MARVASCTDRRGTDRGALPRSIETEPPGRRDGEVPLRAALWAFLSPMLSPRLAEFHRDAFVIGEAGRSTVDLAAHRGDSSLDDLDLDVDVETTDAAAWPPDPNDDPLARVVVTAIRSLKAGRVVRSGAAPRAPSSGKFDRRRKVRKIHVAAPAGSRAHCSRSPSYTRDCIFHRRVVRLPSKDPVSTM